MTRLHLLDLEVQDIQAQDGPATMFRAACACGWASEWLSTNRVMARGRRHIAAMRRKAST